MRPPTALRLLALAGLLPVVWQWAQLADERTKYSLLTSAAVSVRTTAAGKQLLRQLPAAYAITYCL